MSAVLERLPSETDAGTAQVTHDDYEAMTAAVSELTHRFARHSVEGERMAARLEGLLSGVAGARRRRARTVLDLHYPPVTFFGIEGANPTPEEARGFEDEAVEVDSEIRRLQKLLGRTDALINIFVRDTWETTCLWHDLSLQYKRTLLGYLRNKAKELTTTKGA